MRTKPHPTTHPADKETKTLPDRELANVSETISHWERLECDTLTSNSLLIFDKKSSQEGN